MSQPSLKPKHGREATEDVHPSFLTQTPPDAAILQLGHSSIPRAGGAGSHQGGSKSLTWVVNPASYFKLLLLPIILYFSWKFFAPSLSNPFRPLLFISYPVSSGPDGTRYAKGYMDLVFLAYYMVFFSCLRQLITITLCRPIARYFGIKRLARMDRFGEQGYALLYFTVFGAWGYRIMGQLPTYWFDTKHFWLGYPHWEMTAESKWYYLLQTAYWWQQFIVLVLGLEKPRQDYEELIAHHIVTLWLICWSYLINLTLIGNAVFMSMDIPDAVLALSKLLNYMKRERAKGVAFATFICFWTYFRHYLNIVILWSVWTEFDLIPEEARVWKPEEGVWLVWWLKYQIFIPLFLLQSLNLFWYYLIWRVAIRSLRSTLTDMRSDDEDDGDDGDDDSNDDKKKDE